MKVKMKKTQCSPHDLAQDFGPDDSPSPTNEQHKSWRSPRSLEALPAGRGRIAHFKRFLLALLAALALLPPLRAQETPRFVESRYLFIFNTSSAMKKRQPAEEKAIDGLLAITLNGQIRPGDSLGAWTFDRDLQTGEFPLIYWMPSQIVETSASLGDFVKTRHYAHATSFDQLIPALDRVVRSSPRLTAIIFCDGEVPIKGTPIDAKVNSIFKQNADVMKKARQPFIIILRSQFGEYISFSIGTADSISLTPFPPLPPLPAPVVAAPPPPPPTPPPLIIIGSHVGTNLPPVMPPPAAPPQMTAPAPSAPARVPANPVPPTPSPAPANPSSENSAPENNVMPQAAVTTVPTNAVAATPETASPPAVPAPAMAPLTPPPTPAVAGKSHWVGIGVVVMIVIGVLGYIIFRPRRRSSPSLITESLKK